MATHIDSLFSEERDLAAFLERNKELSLLASSAAWFRKVLLLAAASSFERRIQDAVLLMATKAASGDGRVAALVKQKAVDRQYHTYFEWDRTNANRFFGLFGPVFADAVKAEVASDEQLAGDVRAFLELGRTRNELVHMDFAQYTLEKTVDEIHELYDRADRFVTWISNRLDKSALAAGVRDGEHGG